MSRLCLGTFSGNAAESIFPTSTLRFPHRYTSSWPNSQQLRQLLNATAEPGRLSTCWVIWPCRLIYLYPSMHIRSRGIACCWILVPELLHGSEWQRQFPIACPVNDGRARVNEGRPAVEGPRAARKLFLIRRRVFEGVFALVCGYNLRCARYGLLRCQYSTVWRCRVHIRLEFWQHNS